MTIWRFYLLAAAPALIFAALVAAAILIAGLPTWFAIELAASITLGSVLTIVFWHRRRGR